MKLSHRRVVAHTRRPFRIARPGASVDGQRLERVIVSLEGDGVVGYGEAVPVPYYQQTLESVERTLEAVRPELTSTPPDIEAFVDELLVRHGDQRAAIAAIDAALHDHRAKLRGVPVPELLGIGARDIAPTTWTISVGDVDEMCEAARDAKEFSRLKVKVGPGNPVRVLSALREARPDVEWFLDANGSFERSDLALTLEALEAFRPVLLEQPLAAGNASALREVRARRTPAFPIFADEDCVSAADIEGLVGAYDGVNIKLSKCGGITEARRLIAAARAAGMKVMLGCMVETSLGIAAALSLAPLVDYVDLDGHLLLADDPFEGLLFERGRVLPSSEPGLGVSLK